ncbi:hypothetical protein ACQ4WX_28250 [Streptomyces lasalocidi]
MGRRLHGRGALFDAEPGGLAPRLIGLRPHHHRATPLEHPDEPPFVVLTGTRGLGKSAVLAELRDAYQGHTPVALADCAEEQFARPPVDRPADSWSPLTQALLVIAEQLAEPVTGARRIVFPRLMSGLVAVAADGWGDADSERIRREVERILLLNEGGSRFGGFAGRWAGKVAAKVVAAATGTGPLVSGAIEATLEAIAEGFAHVAPPEGVRVVPDVPERGRPRAARADPALPALPRGRPGARARRAVSGAGPADRPDRGVQRGAAEDAAPRPARWCCWTTRRRRPARGWWPPCCGTGPRASATRWRSSRPGAARAGRNCAARPAGSWRRWPGARTGRRTRRPPRGRCWWRWRR